MRTRKKQMPIITFLLSWNSTLYSGHLVKSFEKNKKIISVDSRHTTICSTWKSSRLHMRAATSIEPLFASHIFSGAAAQNEAMWKKFQIKKTWRRNKNRIYMRPKATTSLCHSFDNFSPYMVF